MRPTSRARWRLEFPDGAAFVGFADVTERVAFLAALAAALDVKEAEERSFADGIVALIGDRQVLLVLDNLEQIVDGGARRCGAREPLPGAAAPRHEPGSAADRRRASLRRSTRSRPTTPSSCSPRARRRRAPDFDAAEHADAISEICRRLDGLPLAVELAAARVRLLGPEGLRDRLDHALELLTTGARDSHERQQTLRATIDWSYSLLDPPAQEAFRRLAVFAGGCTLADAEAVAGEGTLDELESLIDAALVQANGRLRMLQTIADFAREQLEASGAAAEVAARHARRYAAVAREIRDAVEGTQQVAAIARGFLEDDNLQAALDTLLAAAKAGDAEALELGSRCRATSGCTGTSAARTSLRATTRPLSSSCSTAPDFGRAGALITPGLGSWMAGEVRARGSRWDEAYDDRRGAGAEREHVSPRWPAALAT